PRSLLASWAKVYPGDRINKRGFSIGNQPASGIAQIEHRLIVERREAKGLALDSGHRGISPDCSRFSEDFTARGHCRWAWAVRGFPLKINPADLSERAVSLRRSFPVPREARHPAREPNPIA